MQRQIARVCCNHQDKSKIEQNQDKYENQQKRDQIKTGTRVRCLLVWSCPPRAFGICAFVPVVGDVTACVTLGSDSITPIGAVLNMSAHAALMQDVHYGLLRLSEYASARHKLRLGHNFGGGNVWADVESRGYDDVVAALSAQLGVRPTDEPVPPHDVALLNRVRSVIRNRPLTEDELRTSKAYSECHTGDGPVSLAVFAGQVALPPYSLLPALMPSATDARVRPSLAVFVAPLAQPTVVLAVSGAALASNPGARLHVTARFTERSAKPHVSVDSALAQVADVLARDTVCARSSGQAIERAPPPQQRARAGRARGGRGTLRAVYIAVSRREL